MKKKINRTKPIKRPRAAPKAFLTQLAIDELWPHGTPVCLLPNVRNRKIRQWIEDHADADSDGDLPNLLPSPRMIRAVLAGDFKEVIRRMRNV